MENGKQVSPKFNITYFLVNKGNFCIVWMN